MMNGGLGRGEMEGEFSAFGGSVLYSDFAMVAFDDMFHEAEPDAGTLGFAAQFVSEAVEACKDQLVVG